MGSRQESRLRRSTKGATITPATSEASPDRPHDTEADGAQSSAGGATWKHLFIFTRRSHARILGLATVASLLVAAVKTVFAVLLGRIMDIVSPLGAGSIDGSTAMAGVTTWCVVLAGLGLASWVFNSALMALWVIFGETVARTARKSVFEHLLDRDMAWFDGHDEGLSSALSGMQT